MERLDSSRLDLLWQTILDAGAYATEKQKDIKRDYKADGSVLTETDLHISHMVLGRVKELFPDCNVISEEETTGWTDAAPFTFILDPIDGTDVYSQGFPSFAIALGILNRQRIPVGAMICCPRFGLGEPSLEVRLDPYEKLILNGETITERKPERKVRQIMMTTHELWRYDFSTWCGKTRSFGSTIIHILLPAVAPEIDGAVSQACYAWDLSAAHAVLRYMGQDIIYADGTPLTYTDHMLIERGKCRMSNFAGTPSAVKQLMEAIPTKYEED